MASWQISRLPIRQGGAALLIVLAVATGTLALSQRQSWTRFGPGPGRVQPRGRTCGSRPASRSRRRRRRPGRDAGGAARHAGRDLRPDGHQRGDLAVGAGQAANVTLLRPDQSPVPAAALFGKIRTAGPAPGVTLPGRSARFRLIARLGPAALGLGAAAVTVSVEDADQRRLPARGRLAARRRPGPRADRQPRLVRCRDLPAPADRGQPGLHAARHAGPGPAVFTLDGVSSASGGRARRPRTARPWISTATAGRPSPRRPNWRASGRSLGTAGPSGCPPSRRPAPRAAR